MFINFTNHPNTNWSPEQISAARQYGEILDIPFPEVDPHGDERYLDNLASQYAERIAAQSPVAVLCQGEMTLAFAVAAILISKYGICVLAACSQRCVKIGAIGADGETVKTVEFRFIRFREYSLGAVQK